MRNLKRALSLALAAIMLIGMMVVSASAVSYNDLTDKDQIVNKDAVSMLVSLGIIEGKPDGSYAPTENVDRAQMAKMLSVIMNKGVDNSALYQSVNSGLTDIASNWAKGHINYCYTTGIIAGRGNGTFDPSATVTALEAAKMLLVAVGYDPKIEGFEGADWAINVSVRADEQGIFEGFTKDLSAPLNRDDAALLIYNALDVEMIQSYTTNNYPIVYSDHRTILSDKYGVIKVEGVVTANEWAILDDDTDTALQEGKTRIYNPDGILSTTGNTAVAQDSSANVKTQVFNVSTPVDMLGKAVTMYVKKTTILADSTVYGAPVVSDVNTVIETGEKVTGGDSKDDDSLAALLKGTGLATDKATEYYHNYEEVAIDSADVDDIMNVKGAALTVIDNDNDGYVNYVISVEKSLTHVSGVSSKNETTTLYGLPGDDVIDNEDIVTTATDLTKGDVVLVVQYGGRTYVEEPKTVTGEMELFNAKNKDENKNYIKVGGEEYKQDGLAVLSNTNKDNPVKFWISDCDDKSDPSNIGTALEGVQFDAQYDFFLDDFGNIVGFREVEGAPTQYALALDSAYSINGLTTTGQIKLLLADGTSKVYDVDMDTTADNFEAMADDNDGDTAIEQWFGKAINDDNSMEAVLKFMGTDDANEANVRTRGNASGNLVAYSVDEDGTVDFEPADLDLGSWVNGNSTEYNADNNKNFFGVAQPQKYAALTADLENGDVDLFYQVGGINSGVVRKDSYGIDEDTIIYYYDGSKGSVVKGYDAMAKSVKKAGSGSGIDPQYVVVSAVAFDDATDVAEVIVVYTSQAKFGTDAYVYVMSVYDKSGSVYTYSVIDEEGNVLQMESKTKGMAGKLCTYTADGDYYVLDDQDDGVKNGAPVAPAPDVANDQGLIVTTRTKYFKVYDFSTSNLLADKETVDPTFVEGIEDNTNENWMRYADKALVIDVENTEVDDKTAATTELASGQSGIVVYNDDGQAEVVYVTDTYKMEVDVDAGDDDSKGDMIKSVTVNGKGIGEPTGYKTIRAAVENAKEIQMFTDAAQNYTLNVYTENATGGGVPCYGTAVVYGEKDAALNANLGNTNQPTSSGAIVIQSTTSNEIKNVAPGTYVVFATNNNGDVTYYAFTFVK